MPNSKDNKKVPEGYFDYLYKNIHNNVNEETTEDLKNMAPHLHQIGKAESYRIPEGYLDQPVYIHHQKRNNKLQIVSRRLLAIAASVLLMLGGAGFYFSQDQLNPDLSTMAEVSNEEIIDYLYENPDFIDDELLTAMATYESNETLDIIDEDLLDEIIDDMDVDEFIDFIEI